MAFASDKGRQGAAGVSTGYDIDNSLRFNDDDSAYLSRTPSSAGNRKTWTWSGWVKRGNLSLPAADGVLFLAYNGNNNDNYVSLRFNTDGTLRCSQYFNDLRRTTQLFRDTSAWYHLVVAMDTTQATADDRTKLYVNGVQITDFSTTNNYGLNATTGANHTGVHRVGGSPGEYFDGYLAEVHFIDGQALDPTSFGETGDYGEWKPIAYAGTYGTNGFYLDFKNSGSLGNDANGSNNWTPTNLAATDQMLDSPTNNFATWNPLQRDGTITLSEGNTIAMCSSSSNWQDIATTMAVPVSGKWYWEFLSKAVNQWCDCGIVDANSSDYFGNTAAGSHISQTGNRGIVYAGWGQKGIDGVFTTYGASHTGNDTIGIAVDVDSNIITFYKNGVSQGSINSALVTGTTYLPAMQGSDSNGFVANFGQDSSFAGNKTAQGNADGNGYGDFYYTPPTGYLALCTQNLPEPTVVPSENFNTVTYTGNGSTQSITGVGFQPDWVWAKTRNTAENHATFDVLRGVQQVLRTNTTQAENTASNTVTSFDSDGFSTGTDSEVNYNGWTYVAWNWKANGTGVSNTNGSITSTVSANADAGFSIVSWTGDGVSAATIGHGLSNAPQMFIMKNRDTTSVYSWTTYNKTVGAGAALRLNNTQAQEASGDFWSSTAPSSTVVTLGLGGNQEHNASGNDYIGYCFHSVEGYSKVGSYTGNGSTDGTFVHCGFRPSMVIIKASSSTSNWKIMDSVRDEYNIGKASLHPNLSNAEDGSNGWIDFTSNGFKLRGVSTIQNDSGVEHIFLAFAENPFKYTNAR
jgi:hypothetical protein